MAALELAPVPAASQEEKRRQILEAAVRAFARKGYHACRVGEIAEEAGVAYGLVYHYFGSKEEMLETIFRDTWTQMLAACRRSRRRAARPSEQVRKVAALAPPHLARDPDLVRVLVREVDAEPRAAAAPDRRDRACVRGARGHRPPRPGDR